MGGDNSKPAYRNAIIQLTTKTQPIDASNNSFWDQFWTNVSLTVQDIYVLLPAAEIRTLREESPNNLATLCYKAVDKLVKISDSSFPTADDQQTALNCVRLLTRLLPYLLEDADWRSFFWSTLPPSKTTTTITQDVQSESQPLAQSLIAALCDLLFCPDFTVQSVATTTGPENPEDMHTIDSCEYIWEAGVGFAHHSTHNPRHDSNRMEILKLLLTCFSETMYWEREDVQRLQNKWMREFTSSNNRHALPMFASLLNVVCAYNPTGYGIPYNYLMFSDSREPLVEVALQVLCIALENDCGPDTQNRIDLARPTMSEYFGPNLDDSASSVGDTLSRVTCSEDTSSGTNLFINYMSRIHRDEDFYFILSGISRLLNNPLQQTYLPASSKKLQMHQELLVLFWHMCEINKKFLHYVLKSSQVLDLLIPILYHINEARANAAQLGLVRVCVFTLLLLSGERNFGVRLNKPYKSKVSMDLPTFTGTYADLLIIVFHKLMTRNNSHLYSLFDCLVTIITNISPYLKSLSMVSANKLLNLLDNFSQPWFLYNGKNNHQLVLLLLEVFNNIVQYQFDGNCNLIYAILRKRQIFYQLANLPSDREYIQRIVDQQGDVTSDSGEQEQQSPKLIGSRNLNAATVDDDDGEVVRDQTASSVEVSGTCLEEENALTMVEPLEKVAESNPDQSSSDNAPQPPSNIPRSISASTSRPSCLESVIDWKNTMPLQTIMRLLQVLVPQVEKMCIDKGLTDDSEIIKFLKNGTLVGLLPVPHPILIRKYQSNLGTAAWFRNYLWGVVYIRNVDPPIWYDTNVRLFEVHRSKT